MQKLQMVLTLILLYWVASIQVKLDKKVEQLVQEKVLIEVCKIFPKRCTQM